MRIRRYCIKTWILLTGLSTLSLCACSPKTTCDKHSDCIEGYLCDLTKHKCIPCADCRGCKDNKETECDDSNLCTVDICPASGICKYEQKQNCFEDHTIQVSAGWYHTCGLKGDGSVLCWGDNEYGQSTSFGYNTGFTQVSAGYLHTCGLKDNSSVLCRGNDYSGQATPPGYNTGFILVSAGMFHTCGVKSDGSVLCWGDNSFGQSDPP